jgi:lipopolysaccharide transport system permease protein
LGLVLLVCALFMFLVALGWLASLVGAVIADIAVVLPSILMLLLALSPIFHRDQAAQPQALQILNQINPFNWYITTLYGLLDNQAGMIEQALLLLGASALFLLFALLVIKRAYKEIAKLI